MPYEYYTSSPYEFFCASEGYFDKRDSGAQMLRLASYRIHQSLVKKPLTIEEFWPIWNDKKTDESFDMTGDDYRKLFETIKQAHGIA